MPVEVIFFPVMDENVTLIDSVSRSNPEKQKVNVLPLIKFTVGWSLNSEPLY